MHQSKLQLLEALPAISSALLACYDCFYMTRNTNDKRRHHPQTVPPLQARAPCRRHGNVTSVDDMRDQRVNNSTGLQNSIYGDSVHYPLITSFLSPT